MKDIYFILQDRFKDDYLYFSEEINNLNDKGERSGLNDYELERLWELKGKKEYSKRQIGFFEELIQYYK